MHRRTRWRIAALCCWLAFLVTPSAAQLLVPRLLRQFDEKPGISLGVVSITQDGQGRQWMASPNGIVRFDGQQFRVFHDPVQKEGDFYYQVVPAANERIWLKMSSGFSLSYIDPRQERIVRVPDTTRLVRDYLAKYGSHYLFVDAQANLWIGLQQHGLLTVNTQTLAVKHIVDQGLDVRSVTQDRQGIIYFATSNQGLFSYNPQTERLINYQHDDQDNTSLSSNATYGVQARPDGSILVGLVNEAALFRPTTGQFQRLGLNALRTVDSTSLPYIYEFKLDAQGNAYFVTQEFLFRYTAGGALQRIGLRLPTQYVEGLYVSPGNRLWISSANKLYEYDLNQAPVRPSLLFQKLIINGTELHDNTSATQNLVYDAQGHPTLTVRENDPFMMQFTLAPTLSPEMLRWRLDGYNQEWLSSQNRTKDATYQLPAGTYTFTVNRGSSDGGWEPTVSTLTIVVVAPFWKRPVFLAVVLLMVMGMGYYFIRTYTRRRQLARQLAYEQQQAASLRQLDELKTRFFGNITHEFRTPLTIILNATEQLTAKALAHDERPEIDTIQRHAHQLLRLITETLDMARLDAGKLEAHPQLGNPVWFIGQVVAQFASLAAQRGLTLTYNTQPALNWLATGDDAPDDTSGVRTLYGFDGEKWEKIAYNLLTNALKFTPRGGSVQVSGHIETDNCFSLIVRDTGIGIPADQLERIFERFHQVDSRSTRAYSGTGIGLALVRELAGWLGGQVRVESQLEQGSKFTVELPLVAADHPHPATSGANGSSVDVATPLLHPSALHPTTPSHPAPTVLPTQPAETGLPPKPLVLVVEDNEDLRGQIVSYLSEHYQTVAAQTGRLGWEQALSQVPDLIVSDVMMPELDGYQLLDRLKTDERTSHIPVILLTARSSSDSRMQGLQLGADDYIVKPFSLAELGLRIGNGLRTRQQAQKRFLAQLNPVTAPLPTKPALTREDAFLSRLRQTILTQLDNDSLDVDWLAAQAQMSRTQLNRKLSALTGLSPNRFIQRIRLERGAELLQTGTLTVAEVAYQIGYESPSYFAKVFQEQFGHAPSKWRDQ